MRSLKNDCIEKTYFSTYFICSFVCFKPRSSYKLSIGRWKLVQVCCRYYGGFKIDRAFLQQLGISTNNLNPKKIHIYGNGGQLLPEFNGDFRYDDLQENAIFIAGEEDNSFDSNDYILFYAKGPHSWEVNPAQGNR